MLGKRVPAQVERRLEAAAALRADHRLGLVNEPHVLAQVGGVGVAAAAARALHAARTARAARCQQHHVRLRYAPPRPSARLPATTAPTRTNIPPALSSNRIFSSFVSPRHCCIAIQNTPEFILNSLY
ncbi:unnamed protein product [Pieris macdunnoughi]|uniref:Uncharacterized protein n=1 Tax=Pieris macdunnoughi TaxID=345717 RepID=A0A821X9R1_9NEOP|nr:unnamed protein product [Pieris macdunnoughi]